LQRHASLVDPIRLGYINLGIARSLVGRGSSTFGNPRDLESGLRGLLEARSMFQGRDFTPGEYVAHRHYCLAKNRVLADDDTRLQLLKSLTMLGQKTGVVKFQLEAGLEYAKALYKYGRPIAARAAVRHAGILDDDSFSDELKKEPIWRQIEALLATTERALDNAVESCELWGISQYALDERDFVVAATKSPWFVSAYGPPGSGRRIFLERVSEARHGHSRLAVVMGANRTAAATLHDLEQDLDGGGSVVLYDLNEWPREAQEKALRLLTDDPTYAGRGYATLTRSLADAQIGSQLAPRVSAVLSKGTWVIEPLTSRPQDTLLLARGFLIRSFPGSATITRRDAKKLIFSGSAARYLKKRYSHIGDLYRAMRFLAHRMRMQYDVFFEPDGHIKVPIEVIERYLSPRLDLARSPGGPPVQDQAGIHLGPEIKKADVVMVQDLAKRFGGRLSKVAAAAGVPRSTLIRAWTKEGVMDAWYQADGRKAPRS
jgi:hypothetical protein